MYRLLSNLSIGGEVVYKGSILQDDFISPTKRMRLEEIQLIAHCNAPPLVAIPGWVTRAKRLGRFEIVTIDDFFNVDQGKIEKILRASPERVEKWKTELLDWLRAPEPEGG